MNTMTHKGYKARVEDSEEDECFVGHLAGICDVVGFQGASVSELRAAFEEAVDDYVATCERLGRAPQKPYLGKVLLRLPPKVHARMAAAAEAEGKSLNAWAGDQLRCAVHG